MPIIVPSYLFSYINITILYPTLIICKFIPTLDNIYYDNDKKLHVISFFFWRYWKNIIFFIRLYYNVQCELLSALNNYLYITLAKNMPMVRFVVNSQNVLSLTSRRIPPSIPSETWNVHQMKVKNNHRTNNVCESWNNRFVHLIRVKPSIHLDT